MSVYEIARMSRPRIARVWLDEWPDAEYEAVHILERRLTVTDEQKPTHKRVAIEWRTLSCGPSSYGLLGAEYMHLPGDPALLIEIALSQNEVINWREKPVITTRYGLSEEYSQSVLAGLTRHGHLKQFAPGRLRVACAAHDIVGSSNLVFGWLARAIPQLLTMRDQPPSDGALERLLAFE